MLKLVTFLFLSFVSVTSVPLQDQENKNEVATINSMKTYTVLLFTGDERSAGTDSDVLLEFTGANNKTFEYLLKNGDSPKSRGQLSTYYLIADPSMQLVHQSVSIKLKKNKEWLLHAVFIHDNKMAKYLFYNNWLMGNEHYTTLDEFNFFDRDSNVYRIWIVTGDEASAGTDANVWIKMCDKKKMCIEKELDNKENNFERNQLDGFILPNIKRIGDIDSVMIWRDSRCCGAGWLLNAVAIHDDVARKYYEFIWNDWTEAHKYFELKKSYNKSHDMREFPFCNPKQCGKRANCNGPVCVGCQFACIDKPTDKPGSIMAMTVRPSTQTTMHTMKPTTTTTMKTYPTEPTTTATMSTTMKEGMSTTMMEGMSTTMMEGMSTTMMEGMSTTMEEGMSTTMEEGMSTTMKEGMPTTKELGISTTKEEGMSKTTMKTYAIEPTTAATMSMPPPNEVENREYNRDKSGLPIERKV